MARRIDRARKNGGGVAPARMAVAPEVFEDLVACGLRKSRFDALLGRAERPEDDGYPTSIMFDGVAWPPPPPPPPPPYSESDN